MKTDTKTKEVLHTQGEWRIRKINDENYRITTDISGEYIAAINTTPGWVNEAQANAELICKAVNERQRLLDSNKELVEALRQILYYERIIYSETSEEAKVKSSAAINNAKNLLP